MCSSARMLRPQTMGKERSKNVLAVKRTQPLHIVCNVMIGCVLTVSMPTSEFAWPRTISWHPWKRLLQIKVCSYVAVFPSRPDIIILVDRAENTKSLAFPSWAQWAPSVCSSYMYIDNIVHKKARGLGMWPLFKIDYTAIRAATLSLEDLSPFLEGGHWLLCKELMAEHGPHISMQCIATRYCCLGVLAGVTVSNH